MAGPYTKDELPPSEHPAIKKITAADRRREVLLIEVNMFRLSGVICVEGVSGLFLISDMENEPSPRCGTVSESEVQLRCGVLNLLSGCLTWFDTDFQLSLNKLSFGGFMPDREDVVSGRNIGDFKIAVGVR